MKVDPSVETYQVGAHFKALIKAILVAPSRILENFFSFHVSLPRCEWSLLYYYFQEELVSMEFVQENWKGDLKVVERSKSDLMLIRVRP